MSQSVEIQRTEERTRPGQETDLKPLNPSTGDVLSTWLKPFGFGLRIGAMVAVKVGPVAVPIVVMLVVFDSVNKEMAEAFETAALSPETQEVMLATNVVIPVVAVVMILALLVAMVQSFQSR